MPTLTAGQSATLTVPVDGIVTVQPNNGACKYESPVGTVVGGPFTYMKSFGPVTAISTTKLTCVTGTCYYEQGTVTNRQPVYFSDSTHTDLVAADGTQATLDPAEMPALAAPTGAGLSGFDQSQTYAAGTVGAHAQKIVCLTDAPYNAKGDGVTDDTAAINAALSAYAHGVKVRGCGLNYRTTDQITVSGSHKVLDLEGGQIYYDSATAGRTAVSIQPANPAVKDYRAGIKNGTILFSNAAAAAANCYGLKISGGVHYARTEGLTIQNVGYTAGSGIGFAIIGGLTNDVSPYFGRHDDIQVTLCYSGVYLEGNNPTYQLTTQTFAHLTSSGHIDYGVYANNCLGLTFVAPTVESNGGTNFKRNACGNVYVIGGFNEGGHPNMGCTNPVAAFGDLMLWNAYPSGGDTGTTATTYGQNSSVGYQSETLRLEKLGQTQVTLNLNDIVNLQNYPCILSVKLNLGTYAKFHLSASHSVELIETSSLAYVGQWSTTKDTASRFNVYWDAGAGAFMFQNNIGGCYAMFFREIGPYA